MRVTGLATAALAASANAYEWNGRARHHKEMIRRKAPQGKVLPTLEDPSLCLGLLDNKAQNNQQVVLQPCKGTQTAKWSWHNGALKTSHNMCLDLPDGNQVNGQYLQVFKCYAGNTNQQWEPVGNHLRLKGSNLCADVTDGCYDETTVAQSWQCFTEDTNQAFDFSALAAPLTSASVGVQAAASTSAFATAAEVAVLSSSQASNPAPTSAPQGSPSGSYNGYDCISIDAFVAKYAECAPYKDAFVAAGAAEGVNPTFLASIAMVESDCGAGLANSANAGFGPFQFMSDDAWNVYGGGGSAQRTNFWDAAYGAARYFNALLQQENSNLYQAMRDWNGPVSQGGDPNYQDNVARYMSGAA